MIKEIGNVLSISYLSFFNIISKYDFIILNYVILHIASIGPDENNQLSTIQTL